MKHKILGWVGIIWGGLIVVSGVLRLVSGERSAGAYGAGQMAGLAVGALLFVGGFLSLRKTPPPS